jgi:hypothetical protein
VPTEGKGGKRWVKSRPPLSSPLSLCGCNARFEMGWMWQDARQEEKVPCFWAVGRRPKGAASLPLRVLVQINRTSRRQQAAAGRAGRSREKTELAPFVSCVWVDADVDVEVADGWMEGMEGKVWDGCVGGSGRMERWRGWWYWTPACLTGASVPDRFAPLTGSLSLADWLAGCLPQTSHCQVLCQEAKRKQETLTVTAHPKTLRHLPACPSQLTNH